MNLNNVISGKLLGTSNQITVSDEGYGTIGRNVTLTLPQNIHTGASPTFVGATLSEVPTDRILFTEASGKIVSNIQFTYNPITATLNQVGNTNLTGLTSLASSNYDATIFRISANGKYVNVFMRDSGLLCFQNQDTPVGPFYMDLMTKDGNSEDSCGFHIFGKFDSPTTLTAYEALILDYVGSDSGGPYTRILSYATGTGMIVRPLRILTGESIDQLVLNIDGTVSIGSLSGLLKGTDGVVSMIGATTSADYLGGDFTVHTLNQAAVAGLTVASTPSFTGLISGVDAATNTAGTLKLWSAGANNYSTLFTAGTQTADANYTLPVARPTANSQALLGTNADPSVLSWGTDFGANNISALNFRANTGSPYNTLVGTTSGSFTAGSENTSVGYFAGDSLTTGVKNNFFGASAGRYTTIGSQNMAVGRAALYNCAGGDNNIAIGAKALFGTGNKSGNIGIGAESGVALTTGGDNVFVGSYCGTTLTTGGNNIFFGAYSGYYETGSYKFIVDSLINTTASRNSEANARTAAILYGVMNATVANQTLTCNGMFGINKIPTVPLDIVGDIKNTTTIEAGTGFRCGGTPAATDGTYAGPTSITIKGGIITAIS